MPSIPAKLSTAWGRPPAQQSSLWKPWRKEEGKGKKKKRKSEAKPGKGVSKSDDKDYFCKVPDSEAPSVTNNIGHLEGEGWVFILQQGQLITWQHA